MNAESGGALVAAAFALAGLMLLIDLALSVTLAASRMLSRVTLRRMAAEGGRSLDFLESLHDPDSRHRAAVAISRQLSLLLFVTLVGFGAAQSGWWAPAVLAIALAAAVAVLLVESVLAPVLATWDPRRALKATAFLVRIARTLLMPVVEPTQRLLVWVGSNQRLTDEEREEEQEEQVEALIEVGEREGLLEGEEGEMMRGIVDLDETPVREIMTPRTDIVALPVETTVAEARRTLLKAGHSRLPIFRESIDNVVGVLHSRDLYRAWEDKVEDGGISPYLRSASFVPESLTADELLSQMRRSTHLAVVVDEYGGTAGLVTLEDLLEEIVGDIRDEHEDDEELIVREGDGSLLINAVARIDELETLFGLEIDDRDFDTVGGLVVFGFGRVPSVGEMIEIEGLGIEVLQADRRRVYRVRVRRAAEPDEMQVGS